MPLKELERLQAVNRFLKLEISKEKELQEIVELAAKICGKPTALITLIGEDMQYIRFKTGFNYDTTRREDAFCNHVIEKGDWFIVPDAESDIRFIDNPLVTGDPSIRFYAGSPLTTQDGHRLGSLCVIDQLPGALNELQRQMLQGLARQVIQLLEFEQSVTILKDQFIAAKRAEIELRAFFESSIDVHLLLGRDFEVLNYNKALERLVVRQYGQKLARGEQMTPYLSPDVADAFYTHYQKALQGTAAFEQRLINYADGPVWWLIKYEPAFNAQGEIIGVSVNSTDVTKSVLQQERVHLQNASLEEIAFIQSHELRRPVASIIGLMNILKADGHTEKLKELQLMEVAVMELDEKIRLVVRHSESAVTEA